MKIQKLYSHCRHAIDTYNMINEGDKIAIGISGGKDSLTLLYALAGIRTFYPKNFDIIAITIDLGFPNFETDKVKELCDELNVPYYVVKTDIYNIIFESRKEQGEGATDSMTPLHRILSLKISAHSGYLSINISSVLALSDKNLAISSYSPIFLPIALQ